MNAIIQIPELAEIQRQLAEITRRLDQLVPVETGEYLTVREVAKRLKCNEDTVRRRARNGEIPVAKRSGNRMLFDADSI